MLRIIHTGTSVVGSFVSLIECVCFSVYARTWGSLRHSDVCPHSSPLLFLPPFPPPPLPHTNTLTAAPWPGGGGVYLVTIPPMGWEYAGGHKRNTKIRLVQSCVKAMAQAIVSAMHTCWGPFTRTLPGRGGCRYLLQHTCRFDPSVYHPFMVVSLQKYSVTPRHVAV